MKIEAVSVTAAKPFISDIVLTTTFQGTIKPIKEAKISPKIGGMLLQILAKENDYVKAGQVVAKLDATDAQIGLSQAEAALTTANAGLHQAEANFDHAKIEFERAERLNATNSIAKAAFDKAVTAYKMASAQLELAKAQVNQAEIGLSSAKQHLKDTHITSPIFGIITSKIANEGERIRGMEPILEVMDISTVKLEVAASEDLITKIKQDQKVKVSLEAYPDTKFTGIIREISPIINPQSRTFNVTIYIRNAHHRIKPGMFARVKIELEKHQNVLCVPQGAVFNRGLDNYLYVIEENRARLKQVKLGIQDLEKVEITAGLAKNQEVVIRGVETLQDGAIVRVTRRQ
ncbi:MAG: efflux RND transporter periplasmic adaptor subunit [bacterium]